MADYLDDNLREQGYTEENDGKCYKENVGWVDKPLPGEFEDNEGVYQT